MATTRWISDRTNNFKLTLGLSARTEESTPLQSQIQWTCRCLLMAILLFLYPKASSNVRMAIANSLRGGHTQIGPKIKHNFRFVNSLFIEPCTSRKQCFFGDRV